MFLLSMVLMTNIILFPRVSRTPSVDRINHALSQDDDYSAFLNRLDDQLDFDHMFAAA